MGLDSFLAAGEENHFLSKPIGEERKGMQSNPASITDARYTLMHQVNKLYDY